MDNNHFYITLPSSDLSSLYEKNAVSHFTIDLDRCLHLEGSYEVALVEIHLRGTLSNITENNNHLLTLYDENHVEKKLRIPWGSYETADDIIVSINKELSANNFDHELKLGVNQLTLTNKNEKECFTSKHFDIRNHMPDLILENRSECKIFKITSTPDFDKIFPKHKTNVDTDIFSDIKKEYMIGKIIRMPQTFTNEVFVYSNICEHSFLGSIRSQILRIVNLELDNKRRRKDNEFSTAIVYNSPHYIPLYSNEIRTITIELRTVTGEYYPIKDGHAIVKLHVKQCQ